MMKRAIAATLLPVMLAIAVAGYQGVDVSIDAGTLIESLLISTTELWVEVISLHQTAELRPRLAPLRPPRVHIDGSARTAGGPRRVRTKVG